MLTVCLWVNVFTRNCNYFENGLRKLQHYNSGATTKSACNRALHNTQLAGGGSAIFVHETYPSMPIQIDSNLGVTAAQITSGKQITIRNIYLPDSQDITTSGDSTNIIMKRLPSNFVSPYKIPSLREHVVPNIVPIFSQNSPESIYSNIIL